MFEMQYFNCKYS